MTCSLADLAAQITEAHAASVAAANSAVLHAKRTGELLLEARAQVKHGGWLPWLKANCQTFTVRMAQNYMTIADGWPRIEEAVNTKRVSYLPSVREALALLAEPEEDDDQDDEDDDPNDGADLEDDEDDLDDEGDLDDEEDDGPPGGKMVRVFLTLDTIRKLKELQAFYGTAKHAETITALADEAHANLTDTGSNRADDSVDARQFDARC